MTRKAWFLGIASMLALPGGMATEAGPDGVWQAHGFGRIVVIESGHVQTYDVSKAGCVRSFDEPLADFGHIVAVEGNTLRVDYGINRYHHERLDTLPAICVEPDRAADDPLYNFDTVWHTFNENYAFFAARGADWPAAYVKYRPRLSSESTPAELYAVIDAMLSELGDGHVTLDAPDEVRTGRQDEPSASGEPSLFELQQAARAAIGEKYVAGMHSYNSGIVRWGWIHQAGSARIAYLQVNALLMLAQYPIADTGDLREYFGEYFRHANDRAYQYGDEVAGANAIMGDIVAKIADADAVILDLRFNGGGKDGAGLAIMNHFTDTDAPAFTKMARDGDRFTPRQVIRLQPAPQRYRGPLYLLTGSGTSSAAEIMALASMPLEHVIRVGGHTEGVFSDSLDKRMPIGWEYTLSNEVYEDLQGNIYEHRGIPPHHALGYPRDRRDFYRHVIERAAAGDDAIEWVLARHAEGDTPAGRSDDDE